MCFFLFSYLFPLFLCRTIRRLIFAFSALTRGNADCVENFKVLGGFKILQRSLEDRISETDLVLKGLSLVSDLMSNEATNQVLKLDKSWCALQGSEGLYGQTSDLDHIERLVQSLGKYFLSHCFQYFFKRKRALSLDLLMIVFLVYP